MNAAAIPLEPARYPALYTSARAALFRCDQVDECAEWANKAAAIASYAAQSKDDTLKDMATRIHARAVRRMGELLQGVPTAQGAKDERRLTSRTGLARAAGISAHQQAASIQVARIPGDEFERIVEGVKPPNITRLANIGTQATSRTLEAKRLRRFATWCELRNPKKLRDVADPRDVRAIRAWCDEFLGAT